METGSAIPLSSTRRWAAAVAQKTGVPDPSAERSARTIAESLTVILVGVVRQAAVHHLSGERLPPRSREWPLPGLRRPAAQRR